MIDVRMREHDSIQLLDRHRQLAVLIGSFVSPALEHPAVERYGVAIDVKEMTGASDLAGGSDKRYLQAAILLLPHHAERAESHAARPVT